MATVFFEEQTLSFPSTNMISGVRGSKLVSGFEKDFEAGKIYRVVFNGTTYDCEAYTVIKTSGTTELVYQIIGNVAINGWGEDTGEPFEIMTRPDNAYLFMYTIDYDVNHTIAIYEVEEVILSGITVVYEGGDVYTGTDINDLTGITVTATYSDGSTVVVTDYTLEGEIKSGTNVITVTFEGVTAEFEVMGIGAVVLKDSTGKGIAYEHVNSIKIPTPTGNFRTFVEGETTTASIEPDFSDGDMTVTPEEGEFFSEVSIKKPENLLPENILKDVNIAGILGTLETSSGADIKIASGSFYGSNFEYTLTHNLGVVPDVVIMWAKEANTGISSNQLLAVAGVSRKLFEKLALTYGAMYAAKELKSTLKYNGAFTYCIDDASTTQVIGYATETTIRLGNSSYYPNITTANYWLAIGGLA